MSRPLLNFNISSLDFENKFISSKAKNHAVEAPDFTQLPGKRSESDQSKDVNLSDGRRLVLKRKQRKEEIPDLLSVSKEENYGFDINGLFAKLEVERLRESKRANTDATQSQSYIKHDKNDILWAEKWRPKSFMDFVGNEITNRNIMKWLKKWDRVVFDKNLKPVTVVNDSRFTDSFGRPERKILLIHGPPGLGKTTVAHVIAKQAGYEVMEVNASDERSGEKVKDKVKNSLSSLTFSGKPVCLIADEVDGSAEFGFIKVLSDLVQDDFKTMQRFQTAENPSKFWNQTGKNRPKFLLRPIIAICNDLYAPALEKLRTHAEIITFQQATERALNDRLKFISQAEGLRLTTQQLKEIIILTNFDIRSCLNILQFGGNLNSSKDIKKKDSQISWFNIVNEIFKRDSKKKKDEQFKDLYDMISTNTNYDKIVHGCFQAYHDVHYQDLRLSKPALISDWLYFSDIMSKTQFEVVGDLSYYCSQVALQFFNQFSDLSNRSTLKIRSDYIYFEKRKINHSIMQSIQNHLKPSLRSLTKLNQFTTDLLPLLNYILTPSRKTLAALNEAEISRIHQSIEALQAFGLFINRDKDDNYNDIYKTNPEFTQLTKFDAASIRKQQHKQTQIFPTLLREMNALKQKARTHSEMINGSTADGIQSLKDQYKQLSETSNLAKKQKTSTSTRIWVKYHEGFSNAVRKNVKWSSLSM